MVNYYPHTIPHELSPLFNEETDSPVDFLDDSDIEILRQKTPPQGGLNVQ